MALKYYHAEPVANSLKSMIPLKEKGLEFESHYVDLHKFEQHRALVRRDQSRRARCRCSTMTARSSPTRR